ncbi:hypothetical protein GF377_02100, partial [candidate division GN15 bacterium]|nr:hypothetical protein [candidate division GN15 bacterium]
MIKSTPKRGSELTSFVLLLALVGLVAAVVAQEESDPILQYYWQGAADTFAEKHPGRAGLSYTLDTRTFIHDVNADGEIVKTDTVFAEFSISPDTLIREARADSLQSLLERVDLSYPAIFDGNYHLNFFPNDTGGPELAIGFRADSASSGWPDGLMLLDRQTKELR